MFWGEEPKSLRLGKFKECQGKSGKCAVVRGKVAISYGGPGKEFLFSSPRKYLMSVAYIYRVSFSEFIFDFVM